MEDDMLRSNNLCGVYGTREGVFSSLPSLKEDDDTDGDILGIREANSAVVFKLRDLSLACNGAATFLCRGEHLELVLKSE